MFLTGGRAYEGQIIVCVLYLSVIGIDLVDKQRDGFIVCIAADRPSCNGNTSVIVS